MKQKGQLLRFVAQCAAQRAAELSPAQRADLFDGIALIVGGQQADQAREVAFSLREAERCQITFLEALCK